MAITEHFLAVHNTYQITWIGLFNAFDMLDQQSCSNKLASKEMFLLIEAMLLRNNLSLQQCRFVGVNQGPGPFTTLRVVIASINGLAFATHLPLIGVNGITTFVHEQADPAYDYTVALCNAYCNDVYYAIVDKNNQPVASGCNQFEAVTQQLLTLPCVRKGHPFKMVGNIADAKRAELNFLFGDTVYIPDPCPEGASIDAIGKQAYRTWLANQNGVKQLLPIYLKESSAKI